MSLIPTDKYHENFYQQIKFSFEKQFQNKSDNGSNCNGHILKNEIRDNFNIFQEQNKDHYEKSKSIRFLENDIGTNKFSMGNLNTNSLNPAEDDFGNNTELNKNNNVTRKVKFKKGYNDNDVDNGYYDNSGDDSHDNCFSNIYVSTNSSSSRDSNNSKDTKSLRSIYKLITNYQSNNMQRDINFIPQVINAVKKDKPINKFNKLDITPIMIETLSSDSSRSPNTVIQSSKSKTHDFLNTSTNKLFTFPTKALNYPNVVLSPNEPIIFPQGINKQNSYENPLKPIYTNEEKLNCKLRTNKLIKQSDSSDTKIERLNLKQNSTFIIDTIKDNQTQTSVKQSVLSKIKYNHINNSRVTAIKQNQDIDNHRKVIYQKLRKVNEWLISLESYRLSDKLLTKEVNTVNSNMNKLANITEIKGQYHFKIRNTPIRYSVKSKINNLMYEYF